MKICWDNLENIIYNKNKEKWYKILKNQRKKEIIYVNKCKGCEEPFFAYVSSKSLFCCHKCQIIGKNNPFYNKSHSNDSKKKISKSGVGRKHSEETKRKIGNAVKGHKSSSWKGGYWKKDLVFYNTYAPQLEWCEEIRRSPEDKNVLEIRCVYCGKWFKPGFRNICNRIRVINGDKKYKGDQYLYCSEQCKQACPIYSKKPETLIRKDALRAGRLQWLELNREVQPELRQMVLKRDNYTCQKCGTADKPLHCHHIFPVATDPLVSADIDNCITLCEDCHKEAHQKDGCRYEQLQIC